MSKLLIILIALITLSTGCDNPTTKALNPTSAVAIVQVKSTPTKTPTPTPEPPKNICHRSPEIQEIIIQRFYPYPDRKRSCQNITGPALVRINHLRITAERLNPGDLDNFTQLATLSLTLQQPPPDWLFTDLIQLEKLQLRIKTDRDYTQLNYPIKTPPHPPNAVWHISRGSFTGLKKLETLEIHTHDGIHLAENALTPLGNLDHLTLKSERIWLDRNALVGLDNLRDLTMGSGGYSTWKPPTAITMPPALSCPCQG